MPQSSVRFVTRPLETFKDTHPMKWTRVDLIYKGSYDLPEGEAEKFDVLVDMYRLAHYWGFEDSDLFKGLTSELIQLITVGTYESCTSRWIRLFEFFD